MLDASTHSFCEDDFIHLGRNFLKNKINYVSARSTVNHTKLHLAPVL